MQYYVIDPVNFGFAGKKFIFALLFSKKFDIQQTQQGIYFVASCFNPHYLFVSERPTSFPSLVQIVTGSDSPPKLLDALPTVTNEKYTIIDNGLGSVRKRSYL
jgi:hypothetical protein